MADTSRRVVTPGLATTPLDVGQEAERRKANRVLREQWERAAAQAPTARRVLRELDERYLPELEAAVAEADRQLQEAQQAFFWRRAASRGGVLGVGPNGVPAQMFDAGELEADPGYAEALHRRQEVVVGRGRLWAQRRELVALLAQVDYCAPPAED